MYLDKMSGTSVGINTKRRKMNEANDEKEKEPVIREERFYLKKLSSEDVDKLRTSSSPESSSIESDNETSDCWAVSKSPLKNPLPTRVNGSKGTKLTDLMVSPVKLKRKSEFNKIKIGSSSLQQAVLNATPGKDKFTEDIEKEILAQIQNAPGLNHKASEESRTSFTPKRCLTSKKESSMPSTSPLKENVLKNKLMDSDSEHSSIESPKKVCKSQPLSKTLDIVLERLSPKVIKKFIPYSNLDKEQSEPANEAPFKSLTSKKFKDNDLAVPLDSIIGGHEISSFSKFKDNEVENLRNDNAGSNFDERETIKTPQKISKEVESLTPDSTRKSMRISKNALTLLKRQKKRIDSEKTTYRSKSMRVKKTPNYKVDNSDDGSSSSSSEVSRSTTDEQTKKRVTSYLTPSKKNPNQTSKSSRTTRNRKKYEMDESSSESSDISEDSDSDCLVPRNLASIKESTSKQQNKPSKQPSSPNVSSPEKMNLRKRSKLKQTITEDFELYGTTVKSKSPKTPTRKGKENREVESGADKLVVKSPRFSRRILEKESTKKTSEAKEKLNSEPSRTPRSGKNQHLSPLVDSVEKISLRNRSEIKKPWGDEFEVDFVRRSSLVKSPRTPSHSLRKQVLESSTRSAKKKLVMESESSSEEDNLIPLRRTPRKQPANSSNKTPVKTPNKSSVASPSNKTPSKRTPNKSTPKRRNEPSTPCTPRTVRRVGQGFLTPVVEERVVSRQSSSTLEELRERLHLSTVPASLPCRLNEFKNIKSFISCKINDKTGGCMYICGVPGTGKTATVHVVIKTLQQAAIDRKITPFDFVEVNSLRLSDARQAYVRVWQSLSGTKASVEQALQSLEKKFSGRPSRPTVLLLDELDYLCNRRQDVVYNVLDWCTKKNSRLIVLAIANTLDLPERNLKGRVSSRMGMTRLVFEPYTYQQLQEIVMKRIEGSSSFDSDAVQLVARKVAAVSGDARRALDICRTATELLENDSDKVTMMHVNKTLSKIHQTRRVQAIKHCSAMGKLLLRSIRDECLRIGVEESNVQDVFSHLCSLCNLEGKCQPTVGQVLTLCRTLSASSLISLEKGRHDILTKITLNVSSDDIHYALSC